MLTDIKFVVITHDKHLHIFVDSYYIINVQIIQLLLCDNITENKKNIIYNILNIRKELITLWLL